MILTLAFRSLFAHPVRTAILAGGFGLGVAVMAILLGVGEVVLVQARAPQLMGGGDLIVTGSAGQITAARVMLAGALRSAPIAEQVRVAAPWSRTTLYMVPNDRTAQLPPRNVISVRARGGIPSLERALGDAETGDQPEWVNTPADSAWVSPDPGELLRTIDRFHAVPDAPAHAGSWAEWLYFNGRASAARFYLTFMVGSPQPSGGRSATVRLQLDRNGRVESFHEASVIDDASVARAPDLTIGRSSVRLDGLRYIIHLDLAAENGRRVIGDLIIESSPGRLVSPIEIHGVGGWRSGYVVPVIAGTLAGSLIVAGERVDLGGGTAYHDHNWGFWKGVTWQWGQVQHDDVSIVYGRVFPPRDAADPDRMPGVLAVVGPSGPLGYTTNMTIEETNDDAGKPISIVVRGRSGALDLTMKFSVESDVANRMVPERAATAIDFIQLRGVYTVSGRAGERNLAFSASGSAETFRGRR
jgi:hypothetical protein